MLNSIWWRHWVVKTCSLHSRSFFIYPSHSCWQMVIRRNARNSAGAFFLKTLFFINLKWLQNVFAITNLFPKLSIHQVLMVFGYLISRAIRINFKWKNEFEQGFRIKIVHMSSFELRLWSAVTHTFQFWKYSAIGVLKGLKSIIFWRQVGFSLCVANQNSRCRQLIKIIVVYSTQSQ